MKILCEKCGASHELDVNRIPIGGLQFKCPACLHSFPVSRPGQPAGPEPAPAGRTIFGIGPTDLAAPPAAPAAPAPAAPPPPAPAAKPGTTRYHVRRRTGRTFGPFLESAITSMLEQGKLDGDEDLSLDGKSWQPLADFPALARYYKAPPGGPPRSSADMAAGGQSADDADLPAPVRSGNEAVDLLAPKGFFDDDAPKPASGAVPRPMRPAMPAAPPPMRPPAGPAAGPPPAPAAPAAGASRFDLDGIDLLAPKDGPRRANAPAPPAAPPRPASDEIDLPAPKSSAPGRAPAPPPAPPPAAPPKAAAPKAAAPPPRGAPKIDIPMPEVDLPAPKRDLATPEVDLPTPKLDLATPPVDLPTPKVDASRPALDLPAPKAPAPRAAPPSTPPLDLPAPVGPASRFDLPAPKPPAVPMPSGPAPRSGPPPVAPPPPPPAGRPGPAGPELPALDDLDLPMVDFSKQPAPPPAASARPAPPIALDLDEPSPEPRPLPSGPAPRAPRAPAPTPAPSFALDDLVVGSPPPAGPAGPAAPRMELDGMDLGAATSSTTSGEAMTRGPGGEFSADAGSLDDLPGVIDLAEPASAPRDKKPEAAFNLDEAPPVSLADELEGDKAAPSPLRKGGKAPAKKGPPMSKRTRLIVLVGGGVAVLALAGIGFGVFGRSLLGGPGSGAAAGGAADPAIRAAFLEDNYPALREVGTKLATAPVPTLQQRGLAAQAFLMAFVGHHGPRELLSKARDAIGQLPPKGPFPPEFERGRGFLAVVEGKAAEGERLLAAAPPTPSDGVGQLVVAWARLHAGKAKEAEPLFQKAQATAGVGPALYGVGAAREAAGDLDRARDAYQEAATKAPLHAAAALGAARTLKDSAAREAALRAFIQQKAAKASPGEKAEALGLVGEIALQGGQLDEAEKQFDEALKIERNAARAQNGLAAVLLEGGRHEAALARYQEIRRAAPKNVEAALGAARCLLELGRLMDADEPVAAAEKLAPADARVLALRGQRQELTDQPAAIDGALKSYLAAIKADDKYAQGYALLARAYLKLKRDADAFSALKQGQAVAPQSAVIDNAFGEAFLRTNDVAKAEERFRAALAKNPNFHLARFNLGAALEKGGHLDQAEKEYALLAEKAKTFPGLPERRARLYQKMGRVEQALQSFDQALKMERPPLALRLAAGDLFVENGTRTPCFPPTPPASQPAGAPPAPPAPPAPSCFELARVTLETVLNEDGRNGPASCLMGRALAGLGRPEEGLNFVRKAVTIDPKVPEFHLHVGEILEQLGRTDQAMQELDLAVGGNPTHAGPYVIRGRIQIKRRQFREALVELTKALQRDKNNALAYRLMGEAFSGLRQLPQAVDAYQGAVKRAPNDPEANYRLGEAYADAERRGPAVDAFKRALQLGGDKASFAAEAHRRLGFIHKEGGARGAAVAEFKRYLELRPDAPDRGEVLQQIRFLE